MLEEESHRQPGFFSLILMSHIIAKNLLEIVENGSHYRINFTVIALIKFRLQTKPSGSRPNRSSERDTDDRGKGHE